MQKNIMFEPDENNATSGIRNTGDKPQEAYTKPTRDGKISYIEREVDSFDFEGYEVVRREFFSKVNCPAMTLKYGSVHFNIRAIRKLDECRFVQILINTEKKRIIAKPCQEDEKDSVQWSKINKHGKVEPRKITGKVFTAQLYNDMKWNINTTTKVLGTLLTSKGEKLFVFELVNAEAYLSISAPSPDNPRHRERIPLTPSHWEGHYGQSYEENKVEIVKTFEGVPEGFVKITLPELPSKKTTENKVESNNTKEEAEDGTNETK
ncbi:hypothetical protein KL86DYS2_10988 [uncultured Dysgonomonas sp.]|uniref:Uncharacterized protein n=1 Tax=uncultured Dysgonomonas sp. TaxID=206096 RepID=A0A212J8W3_9BACT|nr:hypothetical protein [uncultured Dysgonomonas sp.]SBV95866.1 hypothetical protein KL86DYS2_10988 [uncultured Dysgonomonas sp.]